MIKLPEPIQRVLNRAAPLVVSITGGKDSDCMAIDTWPRARFPTGEVNLIAGLIAYFHQPKKPSLGIRYDAIVVC